MRGAFGNLTGGSWLHLYCLKRQTHYVRITTGSAETTAHQ